MTSNASRMCLLDCCWFHFTCFAASASNKFEIVCIIQWLVDEAQIEFITATTWTSTKQIVREHRRLEMRSSYLQLVAINSSPIHDVLVAQCCCVVLLANHRQVFRQVTMHTTVQYEFSVSSTYCRTVDDSEMRLRHARNYCLAMMAIRQTTNHPKRQSLRTNDKRHQK